MKSYNHKNIEKKWKKNWELSGTYKTSDKKDKPKYYILDMFPYPSGAGLHVGHPRGYIATDVIARTKMMQGYNVLHPMGWDAFGLPAENYAIKNKTHPSESVKKNIATFKKQLGLLGFTYDWSREISTTDPAYYKWTQWIFLQMFKKGLAYESFEPINWCSSCQTGLANEDLDGGKCERCGNEIERKPMRQWVLKITDYAQRLLDDISKLEKWPENIKKMQIDWIGKSEGAEVDFKIKDSKCFLRVFTTRPDTLFGATYMVVAPEHPFISENLNSMQNKKEVSEYIEKAKHKTDLERTDLQKDKTGVELKGIKAINPLTQNEIPVFVADYVLYGYGTGAIMSVPAHDERDWEFAKKYKLPIIDVVLPVNERGDVVFDGEERKTPFVGEGVAVNSDFLNNLPTKDAKKKMIEWLEKKKIGKEKIQYKLRDWVFSRQRYWGEPIPLVNCEKCASLSGGQGWVPINEEDLPLELPKVKKYEPSGTGESPLATIEKWVKTKCPKCGADATRETNTMPQWAGSCWYYLRYEDPSNDKALVDKEKEKYWSPVDFYVGGAEHATRHLIYARFWHKFLFDIGIVNYDEPFLRLQNVGLVLAEDGRKMSKRWNNVVNPDDVVDEFGADSMRLYEMFMGPFDQPCAWSKQGLIGMKRFLEKVWNLSDKISDKYADNKNITSLAHQTIKKVEEDVLEMRFNTAIAKLMELVNEICREERVSKDIYDILLKLLSPFAPHIAEELWSADNNDSIFKSGWPKYNADLAKEDNITIAIQINGKLRDTMLFSADADEEYIKKIALENEKITKWLDDKPPKKVIYIKNRLLSIVV
jgi:leucyl-tRNA synthetase